jgi:two-component system, response regulator
MKQKPRPILLAEDDDFDAELTLDALRAASISNSVVRVSDGLEVLDYLNRRGAFAQRPYGDPVVVILDVKMPRMDGVETLEHIRSDPTFRKLPVVMLTSSRHDNDISRSWDARVNAYVVKPVGPGDYDDAVRSLGEFWAKVNEPPLP